MNLRDDTSPFGAWLRRQTNRRDPVAALATVAYRDPSWPGGHDPDRLRKYFRAMGAREATIDTLNQALAEFERFRTVSKRRQATKVAKQARKRNRRRR